MLWLSVARQTQFIFLNFFVLFCLFMLISIVVPISEMINVFFCITFYMKRKSGTLVCLIYSGNKIIKIKFLFQKKKLKLFICKNNHSITRKVFYIRNLSHSLILSFFLHFFCYKKFSMSVWLCVYVFDVWNFFLWQQQRQKTINENIKMEKNILELCWNIYLSFDFLLNIYSFISLSLSMSKVRKYKIL